MSEKGALSQYGLGRFPVTLYKEQWEKLIAHIPQLQAALAMHGDKLKTLATLTG